MVEPAPTRDHTELMLAAAGRDGRRAGPGSVTVRARPAALRLAEVDRARRLLVGGAVPRRGDAPARARSSRPRRRPQPAPHRTARRARADGRAGRRLQPPPLAAASRSATSRCARPSSSRRRSSREVPRLVDELPLVALLASFAHGDTTVRGAEELRVEGVRPDRHGRRRLRAVGVHIEERAGRVPHPAASRPGRVAADRRRRRPPDRDARRGRRACLAGGRRDRGRRVRVAVKLPRLLGDR